MASKKVTITLDEGVVATVDELAGPISSRSAFIEEAVVEKLEKAQRAQRAVQWFADRARAEHSGEWEEALEAVKAADRRRGYTPATGADRGHAA
jgi:metal-responsive CopG/Arc/MetJ family transcriptional regulator